MCIRDRNKIKLQIPPDYPSVYLICRFLYYETAYEKCREHDTCSLECCLQHKLYFCMLSCEGNCQYYFFLFTNKSSKLTNSSIQATCC